MWPSYYGMTSEVFQAGQEPGLARKVARLATLGATNYSVTAPADGEVLIAAFANGQYLYPAYSEKSGRSLLIFPTNVKEFVFSVGGEMARVAVPSDFNFNQVIDEAFFKGQAANVYVALKNAAIKAQPLEQSTMVVQQGGRTGEARVYWIPIGKKVKKGEKILSFDILTGDLLFVDRLSYNFFPPRIGSGFVFRTGNIKGLMDDPEGGDKYFIKRLVGVPGDQLEIKQPAKLVTDGDASSNSNEGQLYRNGKPIEGSAAFGKNSRKDGLYPGYEAAGSLSFGKIVSVPGNSFYAMGDNSPNSKDSRYWGYVPDKDVVGRPLFIYYPLTTRWGPAQ
jgi:signal peptidase I